MDALTFEIESNPAKERKKGMKERREWNTKNFQKKKRMNFQIDARCANEKTCTGNEWIKNSISKSEGENVTSPFDRNTLSQIAA